MLISGLFVSLLINCVMIYHLTYTIKVDFTDIVDGVSSCKVSAYDCLDRFVGEQSFVPGDQATIHLHSDVSLPLSKAEFSLLLSMVNLFDGPFVHAYFDEHKDDILELREHLQSIFCDFCGECLPCDMSLPIEPDDLPF